MCRKSRNILTENESALKDARDRECHKKPEKHEHDVIDGEGDQDAGDDLDQTGNHDGDLTTESGKSMDCINGG